MKRNELLDYLFPAKEFIVKHTGIAGKTLEKIVAVQWVRDIFSTVDADFQAYSEKMMQKQQIHGQASKAGALCIGIAVYSLTIGGGEIFPIHLANALRKKGMEVWILDCAARKADPGIEEIISPDVNVMHLSGYSEIGRAIYELGLDVIHSHHAVVDLAVSRSIENLRRFVINEKLPIQVTTLHGMYEALDPYRKNLIEKYVYDNKDRIVYIADKNLDPFSHKISRKFVKIPNGLPAGFERKIRRADLNIPEDAFVLCLVSRALPEKGWEEAIQITLEANEICTTRIHLILVGSGESYDCLFPKYQKSPFIHFVGSQTDTRQFFAISDMGFLPSRYRGESFPLVLIDSLMCGKPVIATDVGEISQILSISKENQKEKSTGGQENYAGWIFRLDKGRIPIRRVARMVAKIAESPELYRAMCERTNDAVAPYDIDAVAQRYLETYRETMTVHSADPKIRVLISCHKPVYSVHTEVLRPIMVGSRLADDSLQSAFSETLPGVIRDDQVTPEGKAFGQDAEISFKNPYYCELTAQYWAWKNLKADYYGFFHYRRFLNFSDREYPVDQYRNIYEPFIGADRGASFIKRYGLTKNQIRTIVESNDIVTVQKRFLFDEKGKPLSVRDHYGRGENLFLEDLDLMCRIIEEKTPQYCSAMKKYLNGNYAYFCNLYVMRSEKFFEYCEWLFPLLAEFCNQRNMTAYSMQAKRTPGHLAERMWGIYLTKQSDENLCKLRELQCVVVSHPEAAPGIGTSQLIRSALKGCNDLLVSHVQK